MRVCSATTNPLKLSKFLASFPFAPTSHSSSFFLCPFPRATDELEEPEGSPLPSPACAAFPSLDPRSRDYERVQVIYHSHLSLQVIVPE
jgi:hypothetical protein